MSALFATLFSCCIRKPSTSKPNANVYEPDENSHLIPTAVDDPADSNPEEAEAQRKFDELTQIVRVHESKMANVMARRPFTVPGERTSANSSASNSRSGSAQRNPYSSHAYGATSSTHRFTLQQSRSSSHSRIDDDDDFEDDNAPLLDIRIIDYSVLDEESDEPEEGHEHDKNPAIEASDTAGTSLGSINSRGRAHKRAPDTPETPTQNDIPQDPSSRPFSYAAAVKVGPVISPPT